MRDVGWLSRLLPIVIVAIVAPAATAFAFGQAAGQEATGSGARPLCGDVDLRTAASGGATGSADIESAPLYRLTPIVDSNGVLAGQRLIVGSVRGSVARLELPAESFAAGPFGHVVVVGADDGRSSTLRLIDTTTGCATTIANGKDVIRRATLDARAFALYEFRVDRATRADLGVWRRTLGGRNDDVRVIEPLGADERYGATFSTEFSWSDGGDELAVQSCGQTMCRTRVLQTSRGVVRTIETEDQGELIALAHGRLVTYGACRGLPCSIHSFDAVTGDDTLLTASATNARAVRFADGVRIVHDAVAGDDFGLRIVDPASGAATMAVGPPNVVLEPTETRSGIGIDAPDGWVPIAGTDPAASTLSLLRLDDGVTVDVAGAK
jgi:hypothetical protein